MLDRILKRLFGRAPEPPAPTPRHSCSLYMIAGQGRVLPESGWRMFVYHAGTPVFDCALDQPEQIGAAIRQGLALSEFSQPARPLDFQEVTRGFEAAMAQFRADYGIGEKRFHRDLALLSITRDASGLTLAPHKSVHGRYAFEWACPVADHPRLAPNAGDVETGRAVQDLLTRYY